MTIPCPNDDDLRAFDRGETGHQLLEEICLHLENCPACVVRLGKLAQPFLPLLATASIPEGQVYQQAVQRVIAGIKEPVVGDTLRDYRLISVLGTGGMGTVYVAIHTKLNRRVALKTLARHRGEGTLHVRFGREMVVIGRLQHPNIVQATDAGDANGVPYLVMELIDGEDLSSLVKRRGPLSLGEACEVICQAAVGLHFAHQAGFLHRDVKPSNLIRCRNGQVKILDLGLALPVAASSGQHCDDPGDSTVDAISSEAQLTASNHIVGTPAYMSPEQRRDSHSLDARTDVYSLGCTFWFLLTGKPPEGNEFQMVGKLPGNLSAGFWRKFLATNPSERFPTAQAAGAAVSGLRRRWTLPLKTACSAIVFVLVCWFAMVAPIRERPQPNPLPVVEPKAPATKSLPFSQAEAKHLQLEWGEFLGRQVVEENSIDMALVLIPPGEVNLDANCQMGITGPYAMAQYEVTRQQFARFVAAENYVTDAERAGEADYITLAVAKDGMSSMTRKRSQKDLNWRTPGYPMPGDNDPVVHVTPADTEAFCRWLSQKENRAYRLPTEAEWSWAARAGDAGLEAPNKLEVPGKTAQQLAAEQPMRPTIVGQTAPNAWRLHDMMGNVAEWCRDWWGDLPTGRCVDYWNQTPAENKLRLVRGRSYVNPVYLYDWREAGPWHRGRSNVGFRPVCEVHRKP